MKPYAIVWLLILASGVTTAQKIEAEDIRKIENEDPLRPARAAFYSAVLPGLGQAYNKRYWKIPLVYGAIGASIYTYDVNQKKLYPLSKCIQKKNCWL